MLKSRNKRGRFTVVVGCLAALLAAGTAAAPKPALAQAADVTLENLSLAYGPLVYRIPRLEFRGTQQSRAEIAALFDAGSPTSVADRVARVSAREIVAPSVVSEIDGPDGRVVTTYRNLVLSGVVAGRVASAVTDGGSSESVGGRQPNRATFDRLAMSEIDLPLAAALATDMGGSAPSALKRVYGGFSLDGLSATDAKGVTVRVARVAGRDFSARPTKEGWFGFTRLIGQSPNLNAAPPEQRRRVMDGMADMFDAFEIGSLDATGLEFSGTAAAAGSGRIARIAYTGGSGGRAGEVRVEGFEAGSQGSRVRVASLSFGGYSLRPLIEAMRDAADPEQMSAADLRRALPVSGTTRAAGIEVDMPAGRGRGGSGAGAPMRFTLGAVEFAADKPVEGIPTDLRIAVRNIGFAVPPNPQDAGLQQFASLGYDRLDLSLAANLGWNEAGQELLLRELSVEGADMGSALVRAVVGNVSKDVFDPDTAVASVALVGASAKSLDLTIENRGLAERILGRDARLKRRGVEDLRREYGMMAAVGIPASLGPSPAARAIGQAVARFIAKPGTLTIQARSRGPNGFGFADFVAGPDPASVLEQLDITAKAE